METIAEREPQVGQISGAGQRHMHRRECRATCKFLGLRMLGDVRKVLFFRGCKRVDFWVAEEKLGTI